MTHEYYGYDKDALLKDPKIRLFCRKDNHEVFRQMAEQMAEEIKSRNAAGEKTVFMCPVGPVGQYPYFVDMVNEEKVVQPIIVARSMILMAMEAVQMLVKIDDILPGRE